MQSLTIKSITHEPSEHLLYPDYLVSCLLREGIGNIEADLAHKRDDVVEFVMTPRTTGATRVVGRMQPGLFRSFLAHFGRRLSEDMLYGGHALFACEFEHEGRMRTHRFVVFLCNYQGTAFWMRLYMYCIDGVWPMRDDANPLQKPQ
jgi:hypothetical protein